MNAPLTAPRWTPARLRRWRQAHGYTQAEVAKLCKVTARAVRYWEAGERTPPRWLDFALGLPPR